MAKDGDIIDFLLDTVLKFVVWIFGLICKLIWAIVGAIFVGLFNLIKGLFTKAEQSPNSEESQYEATGVEN